MITLITGTPGAGKTLYAVKMIIEELLPEAKEKDRTIYTNINGLNIDDPLVVLCDDETPLKWHLPDEYPDGSIFVFDEIQRQYPPRHSASKVPDFISQYQTHRHRGMDFVFISQGPKLIDSHFDALIEHHYHLYRSFGMSRSTIRHWESVNKEPQPPQSNFNALKSNFRFPKKYFDYYRSASIHTVTPRLPWKLLTVMAVGVIFVGFCGFRLYAFVSKYQDDEYAAELVQYPGFQSDPDYKFLPASAVALPRCDAVPIGWIDGVLIVDTGTAPAVVPSDRVQAFPGALVVALDSGACRL